MIIDEKPSLTPEEALRRLRIYAEENADRVRKLEVQVWGFFVAALVVPLLVVQLAEYTDKIFEMDYPIILLIWFLMMAVSSLISVFVLQFRSE
ncbi:MAG: hypothetical protein Q4A54_01875 [Parabacteroides sp.]|nr:hypothetical protein [Parabacteroides sp.]